MKRNPEGDNWRGFIGSLLTIEVLNPPLSRQSEEIHWILLEREPIIEIRETGHVLGHTKPYGELPNSAQKIIDRARELGYQTKLINPKVIQTGTLKREYPVFLL